MSYNVDEIKMELNRCKWATFRTPLIAQEMIESDANTRAEDVSTLEAALDVACDLHGRIEELEDQVGELKDQIT